MILCSVTQPDLIGTAEAAVVADVSVPTIKRLAKSGTIPHAVKMPGGTGAYLFNRSDVERYRDERAAAAAVVAS